jgi:hypothetical protein
MTQESQSYRQHIYDTKECHIGKLNILDYKTNKLVVLDRIDEVNYLEVIKFTLVDFFGSTDPNSVRFLIGSRAILMENLQFLDLKNYIEYGYVFSVIL